MKKLKLLLMLVSLALITSGCITEKQGQKITVQKRVGKDNILEDFREVTDENQVRTAMEVVFNADWENAKVQMERYPDYQFQFPFKNGIQGKIASYLLWVAPNGGTIEMIGESDEYVKLTKQDSATLYEILTGESLGE